MDITAVITSGLTGAAFGFAVAGLILFFARSRLEDAMYGGIDQFLADLPQRIEENPEFLQKTLKPLIPALMKAISSSFPQGESQEAMIKLPFIGKVPVSLILSFLGKGVKEGVQNAAAEPIKALIGQ